MWWKMDFILSTETPEIVIIPCSETAADGIDIFGRVFDVDDCSPFPRLLVHSDFPNIGSEDICDFAKYAQKCGKKIVITGAKSKVHPYRLKYRDKDGFERVLIDDISQEVRGNRHLYNNVYSFYPAMVWVPAGISIKESLQSAQKLSLYLLQEEKLLKNRDSDRFL